MIKERKIKRENCCWENIHNAKWVSRSTWICPVCGGDVSLPFIIFQEESRKSNRRLQMTDITTCADPFKG